MSGARKAHHPGIKPLGLAPRASIKVKPEYLEACKVLSEETMSRACSLVLNDSVETFDEQRAKSDQDELLEIYQKCVKAAQVIEREAPSQNSKAANLPVMSSAAPAARAGMMAARNSQAKGGPTKTILPPSRRMARSLQQPKVATLRRGSMQRQESDNSLNAAHRGSMNGAMMNAKKPRLARPSSPPSKETAPPQSALQFLAKLNNKRERESTTRSKSPTRPRRGSASESPSSSSSPSSKSKRTVQSSPSSSSGDDGDEVPVVTTKSSPSGKSPPSSERTTRPSLKRKESPSPPPPPTKVTRSNKSKEKEESPSPSSAPADSNTKAPTRVQPSRRSKR